MPKVYAAAFNSLREDYTARPPLAAGRCGRGLCPRRSQSRGRGHADSASSQRVMGVRLRTTPSPLGPWGLG